MSDYEGKEVAAMLKAIQPEDQSRQQAMRGRELQAMKLKKAAERFESPWPRRDYYNSREHQRQIRTNNMLERSCARLCPAVVALPMPFGYDGCGAYATFGNVATAIMTWTDSRDADNSRRHNGRSMVRRCVSQEDHQKRTP